MNDNKTVERADLVAALRTAANGGLILTGKAAGVIVNPQCLEYAADLLEQLTDQPPNDPLTLEELRGMDGEPVWVEHLNGDIPWGTYSIVWVSMRSATNGYVRFPFRKYGKTWLAYRRKPDGGGE